MKKTIGILTTMFILLSAATFAQTGLVTYKAGHIFDISLPSYMSKTTGFNTDAAIQYKNGLKDVYGLVIFDTKEELTLNDMKFATINDFYENFIPGFVKDEENRKVTTPITKKKGEINFIESDLSYYSKEAKDEIYYLVGIVETKKAYYKVLSWCLASNKDKFKADFQKILYSIKD